MDSDFSPRINQWLKEVNQTLHIPEASTDITAEEKTDTVSSKVFGLVQQGEKLKQAFSKKGLGEREIKTIDDNIRSLQALSTKVDVVASQDADGLERREQRTKFHLLLKAVLPMVVAEGADLTCKEIAYANQLFDEYLQLGDRLEDCTEQLKGYLRYSPHLAEKRIDTESWNTLTAEEKSQVKKMIIDTLLMASLQTLRTDSGISQFTQLNAEKLPFSKFSTIRPFNFPETEKILVEIPAMVKKTKSTTLLENHPFYSRLGSRYETATIGQKILLMMQAKLRGEEGSNPAFEKLYNSTKLDELLVVSSYMAEQVYLNSCALATINQALFMHLGTLPNILMVGRSFLNKTERRLTMMADEEKQGVIHASALGFGGQTVEQYLRKEIDDATRVFDSVEKEFIQLIEKTDANKEPKLQETEVQALTLLCDRLNDSLQRMISVFPPGGRPAYLSKKPLAGHWYLSAASMLLPGLVGGIALNYPSPIERTRSPLDVGEDIELLHLFLLSRSTLETKVVRFSKKLTDGAKKLTKEKKLSDAYLKDLWGELFESGGALFLQRFHMSMLSAVQVNGQKLFVHSDPKGNQNQLYDNKSLIPLLRTYVE